MFGLVAVHINIKRNSILIDD